MANHFCNIKAGINTCTICHQEAFYSMSIPQKQHDKLPRMELLRCGHGMCETCYQSLTRNNEFRCPWCRAGSAYIASFDLTRPPTKTIDTLTELVDEWSERLEILCRSRHPFIALHRQIVEQEWAERGLAKVARAKAAKEAAKRKERQRRAEERKKAICKICGRNTFTSEKQLEIHMRAKHSVQKQKKKSAR